MNAVQVGLLTQFVFAGAAVVSALASPDRWRSMVVGGLSALLGLSAAACGLAAMSGVQGRLQVRIGPLASAGYLVLAPDRLGGLFMTVAGLVGALSAWFAIGYAHGASATRTGWAAFPVFVLGMAMVPAAGDVVTFLLAWEVMAIASTVLLLLEHAQRAHVRSAGLWYAVMTHLSFLLLVAGFAVLVAAASTTQFSGIAATTVHGSAAGVAFVLLAGGFATKAGLVPVHVWLPRAHPEAPSHVSAPKCPVRA